MCPTLEGMTAPLTVIHAHTLTLDDVQHDVEAVSYTHLTLPTSELV